MINVYTDEDRFEYDIYSLFKAFFPAEDVSVGINASGEDYSINFEANRIVFCHMGQKNEAQVPSHSDNLTIKNAVKSVIYDALSKDLNITLPWGNLTGIRPTKIPMKLIEDGVSDSEILKVMKEVYSVSDEKALLSLDIAKREHRILESIHYKNGYSLYIGIPFCPTTCLYCSFTSNPIAAFKGVVNDYLDALKKELRYVKEAHKDKILDTIYIGGGTPTTLTSDELESLLSAIDELFDVSSLSEFTVEAGRPDSITIEKLKVLKKHKVTRISVNPQTMNQSTLDLIGRRHRVEDIIRAFNDARTLGFDNINMDIILGLPGEGINEVENTIREITKLRPDSLTVHSLAVKRASKLGELVREHGYQTMINTDETMKIALQGAKEMNLLPYYLYRQKNMAGNFENTGFAKEGAFGIYNILIMEEVQSIIACGAGTVSKRVYPDGKRIERCDTVKDVGLYIDRIDEMIDRKRQLFKD